MPHIDISRFAALGLAAVAGLSMAATDPGITLVAAEAQSRQVADTDIETPSFTYRIDGGAPTIKVITRDFVFCANSGDPTLSATNTRLDVQREGFVFGAVNKANAAIVVDDVRDFSYGKGGPVIRVSSAAPGTSVPGTLVCLSMDDNGKRHHVGSGLFADPFEAPRSCEDYSSPCSAALNSSVRIEAVDGDFKLGELPFVHYLVVVQFDNILAGDGARLVLRDGYDSDAFGAVRWCRVDYSQVQSGLGEFDMSQCAGTPHNTQTIDASFDLSSDHDRTVAYYVRRDFHGETPPGLAERPVIAAALFPDPAVEEMRTDDNLAAYPSTPEQVTEFQQLLEEARIHMEAQSTWQ